MLHSHIDHIVITASSLAAGSEYIYRALGVPLESGGEHPRMGTHNLLLRLGKDVYLEVIAINPEAQQPGRPCWFELSSHYNQATGLRSEEHTSELQSLMRISYAVFCLKKKT